MIKCVAFAIVLAGFASAATPALATDLNTLRRAHKLPPLSHSAMLAAAAYSHAHDLARRKALDHNGFRQRLGSIASTAAENVLVGCDTEECAFRHWARSSGHRRNMLMKGISHYGIASAKAENGRVYWVLELGN